MRHCKVPRLSPQAAAAAFLETYTENSEDIFRELNQELRKLPEVGTSSFQTVKKEIILLVRPNDARLGRNKDGSGIRAIERAVKVWVTSAMTPENDELGLSAPQVKTEVQAGGRNIKVEVEIQLF